MTELVLHLISESSGQTVKFAAKTALFQFNNLNVKKYHWPMIQNEEMLNDAFIKLEKKPGIVLYTISNNNLRNKLKDFCDKRKLPCISVVNEVVEAISNYIDVDIKTNDNRLINKFDESYFDKLDAIEYTLKHDDGQLIDEVNDADILLIGPSRTSKTPTSVYLAYNGFKTSNIPYVHDIPFPEFLNNVNIPMVCGLVINPSRLIEIRESRMNLLQIKEKANYTDIKIIQEECRAVKRLCMQNDWDIIDVSNKSIEETAAIIMKLYYERKKKSS